MPTALQTKHLPMASLGDDAQLIAYRESLSGSIPWLDAKRAEAWDAYQSLPMPTRKDEKWRFASRMAFDLASFRITDAPDGSTRQRAIDASNLMQQVSGRMVFTDNHLASFDPVDPDLEAKGVIFKPLLQAIQDHPDLIESRLFAEEAHLGSEKFLALHTALSHSGALVYVPKGVEIESPLMIYHWTTQEGVAVFPHTLVIAEEASSVHVVDIFQSLEPDLPAFCIAAGNLYAGPGSHVFRKCVQNWSHETISFQADATAARRDSTTQTLAVNLGGKRARFENQLRMTEPGSHATMYSLTVAQGDQEFDQRTFQSHEAPQAVSDLLYKNALLDRSRTIFSGMINVAPDAQQTDAYQTNRNLLLSPEADANSLPGLEIQANDVKCSHGATTGQLDPEELFYMLQRGIPKRTAQQLMVYGFFEDVLEKFEQEEIRDNVRKLVQSKFHL